MIKIPFASWIANAAVGLTGLHGDVTRQAKLADCSRQTLYDHAHKVQAAVVDAHDGGPATRRTKAGRETSFRHGLKQPLFDILILPPSSQTGWPAAVGWLTLYGYEVKRFPIETSSHPER